MDIRCKYVETIDEFIDAIRLRVDVFIREQGFQPGWEPDEDDKAARHVIAMADGQVLATARYRFISSDEIKLERMVTRKDYRGRGMGSALIKFVVPEILQLEPKRLWLRSQVVSQRFYSKSGFVPVSAPFEMWGVPHIDMDYPLQGG